MGQIQMFADLSALHAQQPQQQLWHSAAQQQQLWHSVWPGAIITDITDSTRTNPNGNTTNYNINAAMMTGSWYGPARTVRLRSDPSARDEPRARRAP